MPIWPLSATVTAQALATMALYSMPTLAPEVARDLKVNGALVGGFVATAYGVDILSALPPPGLIPPAFGASIALSGSCEVTYRAIGMVALAGGLLMWRSSARG